MIKTVHLTNEDQKMETSELYEKLVNTEIPLSELLQRIPEGADYKTYRDFIAEKRDAQFQLRVVREPGRTEGLPEIPRQTHKRLGVAWLFLDTHESFSLNGLELTEQHYDRVRRQKEMSQN